MFSETIKDIMCTIPKKHAEHFYLKITVYNIKGQYNRCRNLKQWVGEANIKEGGGEWKPSNFGQ